ncbi:hypothetical protein ASU31_11730 [Pedobacter ginsenosidimutans]|uniref:Uncharacterized protein n=1 Tax=Pedobacter ginsenosidimutans TaxID=687842 RepID=A0A0T5VQR9_9SPHI|nr:hypothetical protein [Pedobacter ginsenosidimutans]KRT16157.1 hypothetical protein ASU31_11730 [Pedobacter ginsenosidimutans]
MEKLKIKALKIAIVAIMLPSALVSCKKESSPLIEPANLKIPNKMAVIPTHVFDWETTDYMPTPVGLPPILVPWASGSNQLFPDEIAFDYKKADGWNLVYNTFSPTQVTSPNFFALYNKYRGIIRFYLYLPPGSPYASSYFSDGLGISGGFQSSIMNFSKEIIDPENIQKSVTKIQNYQILSTGAWYACQYELAYDQYIANANHENLNFVWNVSSTNLSQIVLNGTSNGTLTGTVGTANSGGFNLGSLLGNLGNTAIHVAGFKGIQALNLPKSKVFGTDVTKSIEDGIKGGLSGAVKGFFSAILGGSASSPQVVDLKLKVETNLTGSIANNSGILSTTLAMPGSANSNTVGYIPNYNKIMGVVNITKSPVVHVFTELLNSLETQSTPKKYINDHSLIYLDYENTDNIIYNPEVTNDGTTINLIRTDLLVPYRHRYWYQGANIPIRKPVGVTWNGIEKTTIVPFIAGEYFSYNLSSYTLPKFSGRDIVSDEVYMYGSSSEIKNDRFIAFKVQHRQDISGGGTSNYNATDLNGVCVRYTFLVTPPNGSNPVTIVKTFKASIAPIGEKITYP